MLSFLENLCQMQISIARVANTVQESFVSFTDDPSGTLSEHLECEEIEDVCSKLKMGISGVDVD